MRAPSLRQVATAVFFSVAASIPIAVPAQQLPARLSDAEFWRLVSDFSEPTGTFPSENFASNEIGFQQVIPGLLRTLAPGGAYVGVGPEQNFTYIAALHPQIAFIVDIRRQAVLQHLIYKAAFELADNRAAFLSLLFARPAPSSLDAETRPETLMAAYDSVARDTALATRNLRQITGWLTGHHGFALDSTDLDDIRHVYQIITRDGPHLSYSSGNYDDAGRGRIFLTATPVQVVSPIITSIRPRPDGGADTIRARVWNAGNRIDTTIILSTVAGCRVDNTPTMVGGVPVPRQQPAARDSACALTGPGYVVRAPFGGAPGIAGFSGATMGRRGNDYATLMGANDGTGTQRSYLANEENYRAVRELQLRNLIVPVVGDVSGPKALRSVAEYLVQHHTTVKAYYISNVEQYLFQNNVWRDFYANVGRLPMDSSSTFIRSISASVVEPIAELLDAVAAGKIRTYGDVRLNSHP